MRRSKSNEWTFLRQLAGNVLPFIHWLPTFIVAWLLIALFQGSALVSTLVLIGVFTSLTFGTWALFDRYGMFQNATMRRALRSRLKVSLLDPIGSRPFFVGLATEGHFSLLDTDEDIGYLTLYPDRVTYSGDRINLLIRRADVLSIERRPIPGYSLFGYFWSIIRYQDAETGEPTSIRLLSREVDRLREQPEANRELWDGLRTWYDETATAMGLSGGADALATARAEALRELNEWLDPSARESLAEEPSGIREELTLSGSLPAAEIPAAMQAPRPDTAPSFVAQQTREMIRDGASWEATEPQVRVLLRCLESAEAFETNYELLLGVFLALRARASELRLELEAVPPDERLAEDQELAAEYARLFHEPPPAEGESEAPWRKLRRGRRLQALFARRALRSALERDGA
jgi:hypothetical protein